MTNARLNRIRRGEIEPRPYRLDELRAHHQGRNARQALVICALAGFSVLVSLVLAADTENPPAVNPVALSEGH